MGSTRWSDDDYSARVRMRAAHSIPAFLHTDEVNSGKRATALHDTLDPTAVKAVNGKKNRESRDSVEHPNSLAIVTACDVTGSMVGVPRIMQTSLPKLMGLLIMKGYVADPQIMTMGIGDAKADRVPFQVGQFESGIEIENDLTNLYLEGGGGGQMSESYELGMYFLAHHTSIDCYEKRQEKGYAFFIGDEMSYDIVKKSEVSKVLGIAIQDDLKTKDVVEKLKEQYHAYFIIPNMTNHYNNSTVRKHWEDLFGVDHVLRLQDPAGICELIAATIGLNEGKTDIDSLDSDLEDSNTSVRDAVRKSLVKVGSNKNEVALAGSGADSGIATI